MSTAEFKGQPVITLQTKKGAKAVVLLQGAQLIARGGDFRAMMEALRLASAELNEVYGS